jgi:protein-disulfide isomerase
MTKTQKSIRASRQQRAKRKKQTQSIGMIIIGVLILIGAGLGLSYAADQAVISPPDRSHPSPNMNALGDPNAPVVVEEWSSFACGHCYDYFMDSEALFIENYVETGLVYYIYQPYHAEAGRLETQAAHAAMCAGDQGAFWDMHDIVFTYHKIGYTPAKLRSWAQDFALDMDIFDDCMDSRKYYQEIIDNTLAAYEDLEVTGTPSFVINGDLTIIGNEGYQALAQAVDAALEAASSE